MFVSQLQSKTISMISHWFHPQQSYVSLVCPCGVIHSSRERPSTDETPSRSRASVWIRQVQRSERSRITDHVMNTGHQIINSTEVLEIKKKILWLLGNTVVRVLPRDFEEHLVAAEQQL